VSEDNESLDSYQKRKKAEEEEPADFLAKMSEEEFEKTKLERFGQREINNEE